MKTVSRVFQSVLLALSLSACADSRQGTSGETPVETRTFLYTDGTDTKSRVERRILANGAEVLHGETEIQSDGEGLLLVEDARLDARGQLIHAETALSKRCSGEALAQAPRARPDAEGDCLPNAGTARRLAH